MPPATCCNLRPPSTVRRQRTCDPWDANYPTSLETQRRIKLAASSASLSLDDDKDEYNVACRNANDVLLALLDTNPRECNAIIVVCALTLSSKMLVRREKRHPHPHHPRHREGVGVMRHGGGGRTYVTSLIQTLRVLDERYASRSGALSFRQLWNATWSIARHLKHHRSHLSSYSASQSMEGIDIGTTILSSGIGGEDNDRDNYYVGPTRRGHSGSRRVNNQEEGKNGRGRCLRLHQRRADVDD
jgi:hypothetical protein